MTQKDNILQELKELKSILANMTPQNTYTVPTGYFDGLADQVLARIKAIEATTAVEELDYLSPMLNKISKQMPYVAPTGYFDGLPAKIMQFVKESSDYQTAKEELEIVSPLLSSLKKEMPYTVPQGYFETLPTGRQALTEKISTEENKPATKIISISHRRWFRYAAAAVVTGVIVMAGFLVLGKEKADPNTNPHAWVKKSIKKVSTDKLDEFIQLVDEVKPVDNQVASSDKAKEIKELIKDIPETEIQSLLHDTEILEEPVSDETILN